ncbi:DUF4145 domain-containing protein [Streptomyces sp. NPDC057554]|uniref:DUF4145 domain-containing protein n=1 Tax=Streptomyces sp. NPDC057554 TaxID=3350538 RepID=UPI0036A93BF9
MTVNEGDESLRLYKKALSYAESDPEVFLSTARRAAESILLDLAVRDSLGAKPTLESLLTALSNRKVLPPKMVLAVRTIQNYGNFGSHAHDGPGEEISAEDVRPCLNALTQLAAWYGRTVASFADDEGHEALAALQHTAGTTRMADSALIVVKALLLGCGFDDVLARRNHRLVYIQLPWSDQLVRDVAEGRLDLVVYNEQRLLRMVEEDVELGARVVSVGRLGHSMGGRNFYLLAARGGRWGGATAEEFLADPAGAEIAVPKYSDMFANVLTAFGTDEAGLRDRGVRILDVPHHLGLELFHLNRNVLAVGGQNLRMHARDEDDYFELLNSDMLPASTQVRLRSAAANVLIANQSWLSSMRLGPNDLFRELMRRFHDMGADADRFEAIVDDLIAHASFPLQSTRSSRERLVRHVLFESYRLGDP